MDWTGCLLLGTSWGSSSQEPSRAGRARNGADLGAFQPRVSQPLALEIPTKLLRIIFVAPLPTSTKYSPLRMLNFPHKKAGAGVGAGVQGRATPGWHGRACAGPGAREEGIGHNYPEATSEHELPFA